MVMATVYLGDNKQGGFFNIPPSKKSNLLLKKENSKNLADKVIENALDIFKNETKKNPNPPR